MPLSVPLSVPTPAAVAPTTGLAGSTLSGRAGRHHDGGEVMAKPQRKRVACRRIMVDGVPVLVRTSGDLTPDEIDALRELIKLCRERPQPRRLRTGNW